MGERSPRSQLRSMKRRYFFAVMTVYLVIFLLGYLIAELLFMIFEATPYVKLASMILLFLLDYLLTDRLINRTWNSRWRREAPDLLEVIQTPEPAYMSETPYQIKEEDIEIEPPGHHVRYRRTQHEAIEREKMNDALRAAEQLPDGPKPETAAEHTDRTANEAHTEISPEKSGETVGKKPSEQKSRKPKKRRSSKHDRAEDNKAEQKPEHKTAHKPEHSGPEAPHSSWASGLDGMDTVEFADAVIQLENRYDKSAAAEKSEPEPEQKKPEKTKPEHESRPEGHGKAHRETKAEAKKTAKKPEHPEVKSEPKPKSSWMNPIDELDTVELEEAVDRMLGETEPVQKKPEHSSADKKTVSRKKKNRKKQ